MMLLRWNFTFTLAHCGLMYYGNDSPVNAIDNCPLVINPLAKKTKVIQEIAHLNFRVPELFEICNEKCVKSQLECIARCENDYDCISECNREEIACKEGMGLVMDQHFHILFI